MRRLLNVLKDKASLIKATLTKKRKISSINKAIIRATTHTSTSPPPQYRVAAILDLGHGASKAACGCIEAIMDRLHNTRSPYVALKCIIILHNIIGKGSFILKDQLSFYPISGGHNSLKLSRFRNKSNVETWELSEWVQWYASVLERNLMTSKVLGCYFSSSASYSEFEKSKYIISQSSELDLLRELDSLVCMVEVICASPDSLHYQKIDLVHEFMLLVSEDYRCTQYQIMMRLKEFGSRIATLSFIDTSELILCLKRLEVCRTRLIEMFANRKRNDAFWDLISQTKMELEKRKERRERGRLVVWKDSSGGIAESTLAAGRVMGTSQTLRWRPFGSQGLGADRVQLTVSTATLVV